MFCARASGDAGALEELVVGEVEVVSEDELAVDPEEEALVDDPEFEGGGAAGEEEGGEGGLLEGDVVGAGEELDAAVGVEVCGDLDGRAVDACGAGECE